MMTNNSAEASGPLADARHSRGIGDDPGLVARKPLTISLSAPLRSTMRRIGRGGGDHGPSEARCDREHADQHGHHAGDAENRGGNRTAAAAECSAGRTW